MRVPRRARAALLLTLVVVIAAGYALHDRSLAPGVPAITALQTLASNGQFQYFVILPACLIGIVTAIRRESAPLRLIRHGSRGMLLSTPLLTLLARLLPTAAAAFAAWAVVVTATGGRLTAPDAIAATGTFAAATALLAIGVAILYWLLLAVSLLAGSARPVPAAALAIWMFCVLPDIGVFTAPNPLNVLEYLTLRSVRARPQLAATLVMAAALMFLACGAAARWRDAGAMRPRPGRRVTAVAVAVFVGVLGATGLNPPDPPAAGTPAPAPTPAPGALSGVLSGALSIVFAGAGLSVVAYLVGMAIILCLGIAATAQFAVDWTTRAHLLRIRHGTTTRWVLHTLTRETGWAVGACLIVVAVIVCARYAATGIDPVAAAVTDAAVLARVLLAVALTTVLLTAGVVAFGSPLAPVWLAGGILVVCLVPAVNSPWNPLLGWSAQWAGAGAVTAAIASAAAGILLTALLAARLTLAHESRLHRARH